MKKTKKKVVDSRFAAGRGDYQDVLKTIAKKGKCPFCPADFKYHRRPILKTYKNWLITEASWPYKNTQKHLLFIGKKHKEHIKEMKAADWQAINHLLTWATKKYKIKGGGFIMRFGKTVYTGASVLHLHGHLIVPKVNKKTKKANVVIFPIG